VRFWIGAALVVACAALVADTQLPPRAVEQPGQPQLSEVERRARGLQEDFRRTAEAARRHRWNDSLVALVAATSGDDGVAVTFPVEPRLERVGPPHDTLAPEEYAELAAAVDAAVRAEVAALGRRDRSVLFGFVTQPHTHGRTGDTPLDMRDRMEVFAGVHEGRPYCLQVRIYVDTYGALESALRSRIAPLRDSAVGACRPYLEHGLPGRAVAQWLERGAIALATGHGAPQPPPELLRPPRAFLGMRAFYGSDLPIEVESCMAGSAEACAALFVHPERASRLAGAFAHEIAEWSPAVSTGGPSPFRHWLLMYQYVLADLQAEFGREAFRAFWTSEADVATAFRTSFGVDAGTWLVSWINRTARVQPPGPALPRRASTGGLLTIALLLGVAYAQQRRRRVA
jgi:hypothetical protein